VRVEWRPVHRDVALAACRGAVSAAVPEAGLMADEYLAGAELVPVRYLAPRPADLLQMAIIASALVSSFTRPLGLKCGLRCLAGARILECHC
jgi:hypothetical protein